MPALPIAEDYKQKFLLFHDSEVKHGDGSTSHNLADLHWILGTEDAHIHSKQV